MTERHVPSRKRPPDVPQIAGRRCVFESNIDCMAQFFFEIPTASIEPLLPAGVHPLEPRPDIALLNFGHAAWAAGNFRADSPAFDELSLLLVVQPDLSYDMPVPSAAYFVLNIVSNFRPYLDADPKHLHLPRCFSEVRAELTRTPYRLDVTSDDGRIARIASTRPAPAYASVDFTGQFFSVEEGRLWMGIWQAVGRAAEHQVQGDAGQLFNHPMFRGVDVEPHRNVYLQTVSEPGVATRQRFYEPIELGPAVFTKT